MAKKAWEYIQEGWVKHGMFATKGTVAPQTLGGCHPRDPEAKAWSFVGAIFAAYSDSQVDEMISKVVNSIMPGIPQERHTLALNFLNDLPIVYISDVKQIRLDTPGLSHSQAIDLLRKVDV